MSNQPTKACCFNAPPAHRRCIYTFITSILRLTFLFLEVFQMFKGRS